MLDTELRSETTTFDDSGWATVPAAVEVEVEEDTAATSAGTVSLDPESLFAADLSQTTTLTPSEEEALTRQIAAARKRIRTILRGARSLARAALTTGGRGLVSPDQDFRERETVAILQFAQAALHERRLPPRLGMTRRTLVRFVRDLSHALDEYRDLRDEMIRANVRLVNVLARRYRHPTLSFLDLFQEGTMGLFRAVEKYDPGRHIKFSTYATWWIWQQLGRAGDVQGSLIRTPVHWNQLRRRLSREMHSAESPRPLSREELAAVEGIDAERLDAMGQAFHFVSTDSPVSDDDDRALESVLPDTDPQPETLAMQASLRTHLEQALDQLPQRERLILRRRFGFGDDASQTLDEIGTRLGVSRERVRQLENRALRQLREICTADGLQDYLH